MSVLTSLPHLLPRLSWAAWSLVGMLVLISGSGVCWVVGRRRTVRQALRPRGVDALHAARADPLTGLPNRQSFLHALAARLASDVPLALLLIDLDGFAELNAAYGSRTADELLIAASDRMRQFAPEIRQLGRLGGDSFGVMLDVPGGPDAAELAAVGMLRAMMQPLRAASGEVPCSVSIAVALAPDHGRDADTLMQAAHSALDAAKESGGGTWKIFDPRRRHAVQQRSRLMEELRVALGCGQIVPYYQPVVELGTGQVVGLEVLARWQHPTRDLLAAEVFIPIAEELQLAGLISQVLMRRVIADARGWPPDLFFAFNVSPGQLRELIAMIRTPPVWPEGVLDPRRLQIEVTESAMIEDIDVAREVIGLLQERGTHVVLDDFGVGFSNFSHLRELRFDRIKIDRSFVIDIARDARAEACVRAMLALGHSLGVDMVAEGVETAQTAAFVARLGCRFGQGFHFAEPMQAADVAALLRTPSRQPVRRLAAG